MYLTLEEMAKKYGDIFTVYFGEYVCYLYIWNTQECFSKTRMSS